MTCREIQDLLHAHGDGELDAIRSLAVEQHLRGCAECSQMLQNQSALKKAVAGVPYFKAPASLRASILASVQQTARAETPRARRWQWSTPAASLAMAACLALGFFAASLITPQHPGRELLISELASSHIRSLLAEHLMDVVSTDQHTVKPWFDGRIDFAPPVNDLAAQGYPLAGGRLDYIDGRTVAVLVYKKQKHFINLFIWPATGSGEMPFTTSKNGYNLISWSHANMTFWAVSDVSQKDLMEFSDLIDGAGAPAAR